MHRSFGRAAAAVVVFGLARVGGAHAQSGPNLRVDAVSSSPATVTEGQTLRVTADVVVGDPAPTAAVDWRVSLSADGTFTSTVALAPVAPLTFSGPEARRVTVELPVPSGITGQYFVAVALDPDDRVAETNEFDNRLVADSRVRIRPLQADLRVTSVAPNSNSVDAGRSFTMSVEVRNAGDRPATADLAGYLSVDETLSTVDVEVGRTSVSLSAGEVRSVELTADVPAVATAGPYFVGAWLDPEGIVEELFDANNGAVSDARVTVRQSTLTLSTPDLPDGTLGFDYFALLDAEGGDGQFSFEVVTGRLPSGLTLTADGRLSGQPEATGTFDFTLQVSSGGQNGTRTYSVEIVSTGRPLEIVWSEAGFAYRGLPYERNLVAGGGEPPYTWRLLSGALPPGLTLSDAGVLLGVPDVFGSFSVDVEVEDRLGARVSTTVSVEVTSPLALLIAPDPLTPVPVGIEGEVILTVVGGIPPYTWTALTPNPPGLNLAVDGRFVGVPTQVGTWPVRVRVTDGKRQPASDDTVVRVVVEPAGEFRIVTTALPAGSTRLIYEAFIEVEGGEPPIDWQVVPGTSLPNGFFLEPTQEPDQPENAARIFGRAVVETNQPFAVRVRDSQGRQREAAFVLSLVEIEQAVDSGCACVRVPARSWLAFAWLAVGFIFILRRR